MSKLPQVKRLFVEDFLDQKEWIGNLFTPLNGFIDGVMLCLNKGISVRDNCSGDIIKQPVLKVPTEASPLTVPWESKLGSPIAVMVGDVRRVDGNSFVLTEAVGIQWKYDGKGGILVTNLIGITPSTENQYTITYVIFAG